MSVDESAVQQLVAVGGFDAAVATDALQRFSGDVDEALLHLLGDGASSPPRRQPTISSDPDETDEAPLVVSPAEPEPEPEPEPVPEPEPELETEPEPETESQLETEPEPEPEPPQDDTLRQDSIQTVMDMIGGNKVRSRMIDRQHV
jgi:outer membrane biosynthesis protein TonB